ncbi:MULTISPECIES: nitroreductase/quinone reductase family protein [unclassified Mycolicibacterium]|uniref:nitroreductase/quinone reductase family protein n=1 Tax=unclassified Mycolicibacterium TaxID=2636767 RepID=UPI0012DC9643|nr:MULTISPECIES: nitroreductase/quinone reductase family protein [unclassified Mycolicibacterium]MUL82224.1 nitroreductase family deazaflavin-dependent oxidoreductase [Mycolicibacterium sp. CBMA 329]MUL87990.1 nitroreductase family deazaflavin-dependent oxidoreductase [Mycolicibacterium sp. CBMA 331]MUM02321.1 nitroreductase family deazaflavin-dependent oxidoreductase [Mycolicibacterium sp. CBMA 334]MUM26367.1 nitroreductase family deazaflavin-dependent oxidoreductase [Mycolicibacterium sp. CBM
MTEGVTSDSYRDLSDDAVDVHNSRMIALLRANGGVLPGVPDSEMRVLILTITGARSGLQRATPLGYIEHQGRHYIAGSNGGQESPPAWIFNVRANPSVIAEVAGGSYAATIRELGPDERDDVFTVLIAKHPFFGEYQATMRRTIPVFEVVELPKQGL